MVVVLHCLESSCLASAYPPCLPLPSSTDALDGDHLHHVALTLPSVVLRSGTMSLGDAEGVPGAGCAVARAGGLCCLSGGTDAWRQ